MKVCLKCIFVAVLSAVFGFGLLAPAPQAGPALGKFTLPFDAKIGTMVLPTGDYTLSLDGFTGNEPKFVVVSQGSKIVGSVLPQVFDGNGNSDKKGVLVCVRHNGQVGVRALRTNHGTFYFALPKDLQVLMTQQPQLIETVPVQVSGE